MKYWGLCHPPGFPLYVALGHFFTSLFPFGSLIYKANLFSAIFGALTVLFVYLGQRALGVRAGVALLVSLFFASTSIFWEYAVSADVFTFATFLLSLSFFLVFSGKFLAGVFVLGLSSSHFYITAVLLPIYYWYEVIKVTKEPEEPTGEKNQTLHKGFFDLRLMFLTGLVFALAFFPQAVMWWRMSVDPAVNWGHARGLGGFYYYLRRQEFGSIFLIANPVLTFHVVKFFKHLQEYFPTLLTSFGVILPLAVVAGPFTKLFSDRRAQFILFCFLGTLFIQLFLLSTIDPTGIDNPFQIGKFYLSSFVMFIFLCGWSLDLLSKKFFEEDLNYVGILMSFLIVIYAISNYRINNLSQNYFTRDMVHDAFDELPQDSIAITVSHIVNFGGRYEQEVEGKYQGVTILYFPNEKNRDNEYYHPEVFNRPENMQFIEKIKKDKRLGKAEEYVLSTISKNLDRPIYVLQGSFEEGFFTYLRPYIVPHGLWWKLELDPNSPFDPKEKIALLNNWRNRDVRASDFELKVQIQDTKNYAISYFSTGTLLATVGKYDEAIGAIEGSLRVRDAQNVQETADLISKTRDLNAKFREIVEKRDDSALLELGNNLFTIRNYARCSEVFSELVIIKESAGAYNNMASCQAYLGRISEARQNYQKALALDPNMEIAKQGLANLDR